MLKALKYSLNGIQSAFLDEGSFRLEIIILFLVLPIGIFLGKTGVKISLLIGSWILVIVVELINSAIETAIDRIGLEDNNLSRRAKDYGSASVFCAIFLAVLIWVLILFGG